MENRNNERQDMKQYLHGLLASLAAALPAVPQPFFHLKTCMYFALMHCTLQVCKAELVVRCRFLGVCRGPEDVSPPCCLSGPWDRSREMEPGSTPRCSV